MKKLALFATAAVIALPITVQAATDHNDAEKNWFEGSSRFSVEVLNGSDYQRFPFIPKEKQTVTHNLNTGGKLLLEGSAAYIVSNNGYKYFAPNGPHTTTSGITYMTEDGVAIYATPDSDRYIIEADVMDRNQDGVADDVDYRINKVQ